MMETARVETQQSGNRKYTQLSVDDTQMLYRLVNESGATNLVSLETYYKLREACGELVDRAQDTPEPRICLAYAVKRGTGPKRVFKDIELKEK